MKTKIKNMFTTLLHDVYNLYIQFKAKKKTLNKIQNYRIEAYIIV